VFKRVSWRRSDRREAHRAREAGLAPEQKRERAERRAEKNRLDTDGAFAQQDLITRCRDDGLGEFMEACRLPPPAPLTSRQSNLIMRWDFERRHGKAADPGPPGRTTQ
jgi:hypothetical protein